LNCFNLFDFVQALTKQQPDLEQQLKRQKQRVKEASTDPKHVKALETKIAKIEEGYWTFYSF